jgi:predicted DNA-binding protein
MRDKLDIVQEALEEALDEVATLKVEAEGMVLRSAKQPPSKKRYDGDHYRTAGAKLTREEYGRLRLVALRRGKTVSRLLRDHIDGLLRG